MIYDLQVQQMKLKQEVVVLNEAQSKSIDMKLRQEECNIKEHSEL